MYIYLLPNVERWAAQMDHWLELDSQGLQIQTERPMFIDSGFEEDPA